MGNCFDPVPSTVSKAQIRSSNFKRGNVEPSANIASFKAKAIGNNFETKDQLVKAIREAGLEQFNLLLAIDFTKSNIWQGKNTFGGRSLHEIRRVPQQILPQSIVNEPDAPPPYRQNSIGRSLTFGKGMPNISEMKEYMGALNPYQYVMSVAGNQLNEFDDDGYIPTVIFGHARSTYDPYVMDISTSQQGCYKIDDSIAAYENAASTNRLSGPTLFAPIIKWGMEKVITGNNAYHILLIIGDGAIDDFDETVQMLCKASKYPLSIIFCGVGDGSDPDHPTDKWARMRALDDVPKGDVDNWQSVYIANLQPKLSVSAHPDLDLVTQMMMEIPEQYQYFKSKGLIYH